MSGIVMYGADWCSDCRRSKNVLDALGVLYQYIDIEKDPAAAQQVVEINNGYQSIPTILFSDGRVLVEPSDRELEEAVKQNTEKRGSN